MNRLAQIVTLAITSVICSPAFTQGAGGVTMLDWAALPNLAIRQGKGQMETRRCCDAYPGAERNTVEERGINLTADATTTLMHAEKFR